MAAKILEIVMLVCFGCSWPLNVYKSLKTKSTKGKSLFFLILIDLGYVAGMIGKSVNEKFVWATDWYVFAFYVLNFSMVTFDLILYFINWRREKNEKQPVLPAK